MFDADIYHYFVSDSLIENLQLLNMDGPTTCHRRCGRLHGRWCDHAGDEYYIWLVEQSDT